MGTDIFIYFWSDLRNVDQMSFEFELGIPFKPYEQLMGVLPVASMEHIPVAYRVCRFLSQMTLSVLLFEYQ